MFHCNSTTTPAVLQAAAGNRCSQDLRWHLLRSGLSLLPKMLRGDERAAMWGYELMAVIKCIQW